MNYVVYGQEITLFKLPHIKFQPKATLNLCGTLEVSMAAVVVKIKEDEFRAVIKYFYK